VVKKKTGARTTKRPRGRPPKGVDPDPVLFVRTPQGLLDRIDTHVKRLAARTPGAKFNRSDAVRTLIEKALALEESDEGARSA
jgi:hypothetical protein